MRWSAPLRLEFKTKKKRKKERNVIWAHRSGPPLTAAASLIRGSPSPSAVQHRHDPVRPSAGVQDTVRPLDHWPEPQSISQPAWPTLHSPVDDIASRVTSTPLSKRTRHKDWAYSSEREHFPLTTTSVSCNSLRANINWVWTSMKDTANSHSNVCVWKKSSVVPGAGAKPC